MTAANHHRFSMLFFIGCINLLTSLSMVGQVNPRVPTNFSLQINGIVRYAADRRPAENVLVRLEAFSGGLVGQIATDRTGKFSFTGLVAQQYIVTVHQPGFRDVRQTVDLLTQNTGYLNVDLIADRDAIGAQPDTVNGVINAGVPAEAQAAYDKARELLDSGDAKAVPDAIKSLERAVSLHHDYLEAQILLGLAYMDSRNWDKAEAALRAAVAINDHATTAIFALGDVYLSEKKYAEGVTAVGEALKLNPDAARGHLTLAKLYWEMAPKATDEKDFRSKAESGWSEVSKALKIDPDLAEAHVVAGNMLLRARRPKDALAHFETYLRLMPNGEFATETTAIIKKIKDGLQQQ